jgi:hypothetical protein
MSKNPGVVYTKPGEVQVQDIADPKFENPRGRKIEHGVILKRPPRPATSVSAWALAGPSRTPSTQARRPSCATIANS